MLAASTHQETVCVLQQLKKQSKTCKHKPSDLAFTIGGRAAVTGLGLLVYPSPINVPTLLACASTPAQNASNIAGGASSKVENASEFY